MNAELLFKLLHYGVSYTRYLNAGAYRCMSVQKGHVQLINQLKPLHTPVMLQEVVECLCIEPKSLVLDMTFGAGGHTKELLSIHEDCHVLAADRDERAINEAKALSKTCGRVSPILGKFSELSTLLDNLGYGEGSLDGVLIDAGCSSMQFDEADRGFSVARDGPLDMRMDGNRDSSQMTAADVVNNLSVEDLTHIILKYGEENKAETIAQCIVDSRPITRTKDLAQVVSQAVAIDSHSKHDSLGRRCHAATKTFMALRIFVNDEMNELHAGIACAEKHLRHGGRLVLISFHSLEGRIINRCLRKIVTLDKTKIAQGEKKSKRSTVMWPWKKEKDLYCCPSEEEVAMNARARSAFMRVATRNRIP